MRFGRASVGLVVISFTLACGSDKATGPENQIILSAAQATALMNKITQFAALQTEIAWLGDSANLVLKSGAEADLIPVSTNLGPGPFYAVGLQRAVQLPTNPFSTFDLIAFNDPSNPTDFIMVDGYIQGSGAPPTSVSGVFDGPVNGYFFHTEGSTVTAWRAALGTAALSRGGSGGGCTGFQSSSGVTCTLADLTTSFTVTAAFQDAGPQSNAIVQASLNTTTVAGILLSFPLP
jgi:hypothetical protein